MAATDDRPGTRIKGASLLARLEYVTEQGGPELLERVLARLAPAGRKVLEGHPLRGSSFPLELNGRLDEAIAHAVNPLDPIGVYRELDRASAQKNLGKFHAIFLRGENPHAVLEGFPAVRGTYYSDGTASYERTRLLVARAAAQGARVIAFPETWLPGYPAWLDCCRDVGLWDNPPMKQVFVRLRENPDPRRRLAAGEGDEPGGLAPLRLRGPLLRDRLRRADEGGLAPRRARAVGGVSRPAGRAGAPRRQRDHRSRRRAAGGARVGRRADPDRGPRPLADRRREPHPTGRQQAPRSAGEGRARRHRVGGPRETPLPQSGSARPDRTAMDPQVRGRPRLRDRRAEGCVGGPRP